MTLSFVSRIEEKNTIMKSSTDAINHVAKTGHKKNEHHCHNKSFSAVQSQLSSEGRERKKRAKLQTPIAFQHTG